MTYFVALPSAPSVAASEPGMQTAGLAACTDFPHCACSPPVAGSSVHGIDFAAAMIDCGVASPFKFWVAMLRPSTPWNIDTPVVRLLSTLDAPYLSRTAAYCFIDGSFGVSIGAPDVIWFPLRKSAGTAVRVASLKHCGIAVTTPLYPAVCRPLNAEMQNVSFPSTNTGPLGLLLATFCICGVMSAVPAGMASSSRLSPAAL